MGVRAKKQAKRIKVTATATASKRLEDADPTVPELIFDLSYVDTETKKRAVMPIRVINPLNKDSKKTVKNKRLAKIVFDAAYEMIKDKIGHDGQTSGKILQKCGRSLFGKKFIGVFPLNEVPKDVNGFAIVNDDFAGNKGTHWRAFILQQNESPVIYDPLKVTPADNEADQHPAQENCGQLCLTALEVYHRYPHLFNYL